MINRQYQGRVNNAQGRLFEDRILAACEYYRRMEWADMHKTPETFRCLHKNERGRFTGQFIDCYQNKYNVDFGFIDVKKLSGLPYSRIEDFCQNMHRNIVLGTNQVVPENVWIGRRNK